MIKKCIGCGISLQCENESELGYTPRITNDYCMRCFKLKNYGQEILPDYQINNDTIIKKINAKKAYTLFLTDFLNISNFVLNKYKKITNKKALVITKKDLFPNNIKIEKFIKNIKEYYQIKEDIYFISTKDSLTSFYQDISKHNTIVVAGYTSSGKSSLINKLMGSNILESNRESTTLDFITIKNNELKMIDSPGFIPEIDYFGYEIKTRIKPNIKVLKPEQEILLGDVSFKSNVQNNLIFYLADNATIIKRKKEGSYVNRINVPANSDLVILGMGFINIKNNCQEKFPIV